MGMFDLHMKLHRAIKFLGGVQTSTSHSLFHHVFSEMEKADFFEPLNVPGLNHAQESFGRVKAKNQWLVLQVNSMNTSPVPRNMPGHDLISYSRCSLSPLWDFLWVEDVGCRYSTLRVERMSLFLEKEQKIPGKICMTFTSFQKLRFHKDVLWVPACSNELYLSTSQMQIHSSKAAQPFSEELTDNLWCFHQFSLL